MTKCHALGSYYKGADMAKKRHHASHKKQSRLSRFHEHAGQERNLHGLHHSEMAEHAAAPHAAHPQHRAMMRRKYDTLRHERPLHNDERHHDQFSEQSGPYHYDREGMDEHRIAESRSGRYKMMDGKYEGYRGRRHQEMADAGMIHEDHREIANLPQQVMIKPYGDSYGYTPEDLDDTIRGIDRQVSYDDGQKMRGFFPKKV